MSGPLGDPVATGDDFTSRTTPSPPHITDTEARLYYHGPPAKPLLVARTGSTTWEEPGLEAYPREKQLGVVGKHEIGEIWEVLGPKVYDILNKAKVDWTSVDLVRLGYVDEQPGPVIIWIGITYDSQVPYKFLTRLTTAQLSKSKSF